MLVTLTILLIMISDIYLFFSKKAIGKDQYSVTGKPAFIENPKYIVKSLHYIGIILALIFFSNTLYTYPILSVITFGILSLLWLYAYYSKRLIVSANGLAYIDIFNTIIDFRRWAEIEHIYIEKTKIILQLNSGKQHKYSISLNTDEFELVKNIIPKNINEYAHHRHINIPKS